MPTRFQLTVRPVRAGLLLLLVLLTAFAGEVGIMWLLPHVLPEDCGIGFEAVADATALTLVVAPVLWILVVRPIQRLSQSRMEFLERALTTQEDERRRITQDLHDGLGQSLTSLLLGLRAVEVTTSEDKVREQVQALRQLGAGLHDDLRRIVRGLRPVILDQQGLVPAIERMAEEMRTAVSGALTVEADDLREVRLAPQLESTAFRIVQEALSNAVRHSGASRIHVELSASDKNLELSIVDNGCGFEPASAVNQRRGTYGLLSIRERAMIAGGHADVSSSRGGGTVVTATLPLKSRSTGNV